MRPFLIGAALIAALSLSAQTSRLHLDVDTVMRGHGLAGYPPQSVRWSNDSKRIYFEWKQYTDPVEKRYDTYVVSRDGTGLRKLSPAEAKDAVPENARYARDRSRAVFVDGGDVFLYDEAAHSRWALTRTTEEESSARFTQDERHVAFVRNQNLFVVSLDDASVRQVTNIVEGDEKGENVALFDDPLKNATASQKWIADEANKLSDVVARRAAEKNAREAERRDEIAVAPFKLENGQSVADLSLTPDGQYVVAFVSTKADKAKRTTVPNYVTDTGYTTDLSSRAKVGDVRPASRIAIVSTRDGSVKWLEHGLKRLTPAAQATKRDETKSVTKQKVEATAQKTESGEAQQRDFEIESLYWSDDGTSGFILVRAADNKDWWLLALDPAAAKTRVLFNEHDPAWVQWVYEGMAGFVPGTNTVWLLSERTGWMHLYTVPFEGGEPRALTSGTYEVDHVQPSVDGKMFFLTASRESPFERHLYKMPSSGGAMEKLTTAAGWHEAVVSPDGTTAADVYSYTNRPPELFAGPTRVTSSPAPEFSTYPWLDAPIVRIPARDGAQVPARLYKPANWNGGPAVIFVHGAGYLQNVHRGWSSYFREYMFHHLLMERGYLVLDADYRASAGYGRDWRTAIYRHMGGVDLTDQVDAAQWLVREQGVDPKRIGIYGGSYGGFITLMAMFTTPDVFAAGAALRPVTDWAHYNHEYTSGILNTPQEDPEAYRKSSPIYFAEGLKGALLICHGVVDVNVHYQDTMRLVQRLIELRKENWTVAPYPLEDHSFVEPTSWADEYKRILRLFEEELR